jgi:hypothetical protein
MGRVIESVVQSEGAQWAVCLSRIAESTPAGIQASRPDELRQRFRLCFEEPMQVCLREREMGRNHGNRQLRITQMRFDERFDPGDMIKRE